MRGRLRRHSPEIGVQFGWLCGHVETGSSACRFTRGAVEVVQEVLASRTLDQGGAETKEGKITWTIGLMLGIVSTR